jgi:hypothetical protein
MEAKLKELDQLYKDNESLRIELATYRSQVDLDAQERKF